MHKNCKSIFTAIAAVLMFVTIAFPAMTVKQNEPDATLRRAYFHCADATDGMTPETGEAGGQPQIGTPGIPWFTNSGISTLAHMGNGRYYAPITQTATNIADGSIIQSRYKSTNTAECVGETIQIQAYSAADVYNYQNTYWPTFRGAYLDTTMSSRLPTASYTAPDNAAISTIAGQIARLQWGSNNYIKSIPQSAWASYTTPPSVVDIEASSILAKEATLALLPTLLQIEASSVLAMQADLLDRLAAADYTAPDNASITAIKTQTDKMQWGSNNYIKSIPQTSLVALPALQGTAYTAVATQSREVSIVRGDTTRITFDLGADYTGWTAHFGAKAKAEDTAFIIAEKACTWTDAAAGEGYVDLTATDTGTARKLYAEIELRNGTSRLTAIKFTLKIIEDVVR